LKAGVGSLWSLGCAMQNIVALYRLKYPKPPRTE
jgi:hypothetical protein